MSLRLELRIMDGLSDVVRRQDGEYGGESSAKSRASMKSSECGDEFCGDSSDSSEILKAVKA